MQSIMLADPPSQPTKLKQGDLCLAVFSQDKQLYRYLRLKIWQQQPTAVFAST
jgi:hypothetical protein